MDDLDPVPWKSTAYPSTIQIVEHDRDALSFVNGRQIQLTAVKSIIKPLLAMAMVLADTCEICGDVIKTIATKVEIDGALLRVCPVCAKLGRPLGAAKTTGVLVRPRGDVALVKVEQEYDLDPEYSVIVRRARERMGLTQEELGRLLNVKPSVISHIETGKFVPDIALAKKLMHHLKVNILLPADEVEGKKGV